MKNTVNAILENLRLNEVKSVAIGNGAKIYRKGDHYYLKKGDERKEISSDQYWKLYGNRSTTGDKVDKSDDNSSSNSKDTNSKINNIQSITKEIRNTHPTKEMNKFFKLQNQLGDATYKDFNNKLKKELSDDEYQSTIDFIKNDDSWDYTDSKKAVNDTVEKMYPNMSNIDQEQISDLLCNMIRNNGKWKWRG